MRVRFEDEQLRLLFVEAEHRIASIGPELTSAFRKKIALLVRATDERDLYALKSLHFERMKGDRTGQSSIRINKQWRLILRIEADDDGKVVVIVELLDYH